VPNVVGQTAGNAHNTIVAAGLVPVDDNWTSGDAPRLVTGQSPTPGTQVAPGSRVGYTVAPASAAPPPGGVTVPDVVGQTSGQAHNIIVAAGLVPVDGDWVKGDAGTKVKSQSPAAGSQVSKSTRVTYYH
jgi:beta-lactam-binding protein with PASTA domain